MWPDGSHLQRLTNGPAVDERPDWSPDGATIAFSRNSDIWTMDSDGLNEVQLTSLDQDEFAPAFSPNGNRIAYNRGTADGKFGVWTMRTDGSDRVRRTFGRFDFFPDWQPL
jgi:TolB protein